MFRGKFYRRFGTSLVRKARVFVLFLLCFCLDLVFYPASQWSFSASRAEASFVEFSYFLSPWLPLIVFFLDGLCESLYNYLNLLSIQSTNIFSPVEAVFDHTCEPSARRSRILLLLVVWLIRASTIHSWFNCLNDDEVLMMGFHTLTLVLVEFSSTS